MRRGDWFFIFLSVAIVAIAVLDAIISYQNHKPDNPNIVVIEPERTQSVTGPALVILDNPKHTQSTVQPAPKRTTQK
jgi:hypothetical protein